MGTALVELASIVNVTDPAGPVGVPLIVQVIVRVEPEAVSVHGVFIVRPAGRELPAARPQVKFCNRVLPEQLNVPLYGDPTLAVTGNELVETVGAAGGVLSYTTTSLLPGLLSGSLGPAAALPILARRVTLFTVFPALSVAAQPAWGGVAVAPQRAMVCVDVTGFCGHGAACGGSEV